MKKIVLIFPLLFLLSGSIWAAQKAELEIHFIDVGYGDAILLKDSGGKVVLIDTGYPQYQEKLIQWLRIHRVTELEHLIVTHPHGDHLGCATAILKNFKVKRLWDNGQKIDRFSQRLTEEMVKEYEQRFRAHPAYRVLRAEDRITWGEITLDVLWPRDTVTYDDWNTNSTPIMLRYQKLAALLAADFNEEGERKLLEAEGIDLKADLLKVGHHGAGDATSPEFLKRVSPRWAVISVGDNPWGYPAGAVINRLQDAGATVFRTDLDGTATFRYLPPREIEIYTRNVAPLLTGLKE